MATQHDAQHGGHDAHGATHGTHHSVRGDRTPAFIGLIGGAIFIFAVLFGVVLWTNGRFAGHGEGAKAEATK